VPQQLELGTGFKAILIGLALIIILLGVFPQLLINRLYIIYL